MRTLLWADDDADDLLLMKDILLKNGKEFNIVEVANGKEAIDYLNDSVKKNDVPCLVILDINMPVMDGKQTLALMKNGKRFANIPVVVFTTSNSELDKLFCKQMNVEMITKPPQYASLQNAVMHLLSFCRE